VLDSPVGHPVAAAVTEIAAVLDGVSDASLWSMTDGQVASVTAAAGRLVAGADRRCRTGHPHQHDGHRAGSR